MSLPRAAAVWLGVLLPAFSFANPLWYLENRPYFDPLLSDPYATQMSVLFPAAADSFPFALNPGRSLVWDISVGHEFPMLGWESGPKRTPATDTLTGVAAGAIGIGVWLPLSFHMIEDLSKDPSRPILDTDYRFGAQLKVQYGLPGAWGTRTQTHIGLKFQAGHESTHVGDEFTISAIEHYPDTFLRVNVSYEYYDVALTFEPNFGAGARHHLRFRAGRVWLWHPQVGWYTETHLLYPLGAVIAPSRRNAEPYGEVEFTYALPGKQGRPSATSVIASVDIRDRTVFQYQAILTHEEPSEISVNSMIGLRYKRSSEGLTGRISPTLYLRYYHGVNPNGQFRSQAHFSLYGVGVEFGL